MIPIKTSYVDERLLVDISMGHSVEVVLQDTRESRQTVRVSLGTGYHGNKIYLLVSTGGRMFQTECGTLVALPCNTVGNTIEVDDVRLVAMKGHEND